MSEKGAAAACSFIFSNQPVKLELLAVTLLLGIPQAPVARLIRPQH